MSVAFAIPAQSGALSDRNPTRSTSSRLQPGRALRAMRRLVADKDDTEQVFEIMNALSGRSPDWGYARMLTTPEGSSGLSSGRVG